MRRIYGESFIGKVISDTFTSSEVIEERIIPSSLSGDNNIYCVKTSQGTELYLYTKKTPSTIAYIVYASLFELQNELTDIVIYPENPSEVFAEAETPVSALEGALQELEREAVITKPMLEIEIEELPSKDGECLMIGDMYDIELKDFIGFAVKVGSTLQIPYEGKTYMLNIDSHSQEQIQFISNISADQVVFVGALQTSEIEKKKGSIKITECINNQYITDIKIEKDEFDTLRNKYIEGIAEFYFINDNETVHLKQVITKDETYTICEKLNGRVEPEDTNIVFKKIAYKKDLGDVTTLTDDAGSFFEFFS